MKKIAILVSILFCGCNFPTPNTSVNDFQDVQGILYYEVPKSGSTVTCVFLPYSSNHTDIQDSIINLNNYNAGIQFFTPHWKVKKALYSHRNLVGHIEGDTSKKIYFLPRCRIFFHIDTPMFTEKSVIRKELLYQKIIFRDTTRSFKYYFSNINVDSLKFDH